MQEKYKTGAAIIVFIIALAVYLFTLCPTVYVGDSGEFTASAYLLGISHPPGYPLYSIIGKIFTFIPCGSVASRVNFMSSFFAAVTVLALYFIMSQITGSIPVSVSASLLFAFSSTFWDQALVSEVYILNVFFTAACLLILFLWEKMKEDRLLYLFSFIYGLGLTNHYISILFAPAYLYFIIATLKSSGRSIFSVKKRLFTMLSFVILALLVYIYLPLRSLSNPPLDWGNPENLTNFINHIKRVQYREFEFGQTVGLKVRGLFLWNFIEEFSSQFTTLLVWLPLSGIWFLLKRKKKKLLLTTILIFLANTAGLIATLNFKYTTLGKAIFEVYYLPAYLVSAVWAGYALNIFTEKLKKSRAVFSLLFFLPVLPLVFHYPVNNNSSYYLAYDYGTSILDTVETGGKLLALGDNQTFIIAYLKFVEKKRTDITVYNSDGIVFPCPYGETYLHLDKEEREKVKKELNRNLIAESNEPVYFSLRFAPILLYDTDYMPVGLLARGLKQGETYTPAKNLWAGYSIRGMEEGRRSGEYWTKDIAGEFYYNRGNYYVSNGLLKEGVESFRQASGAAYNIEWVHNKLYEIYDKLSLSDDAKKEAFLGARFDPHEARPHDNLGVVFFREGKIDESIKEFEKAAKADPDDMNVTSNLTNAYLAKGMKEKAIKLLSSVLKKHPDSTDTYTRLGSIYESAGMYDSALALYKKAIGNCKNVADFYNNMGNVYQQKKLFGEAMEMYRKALDISFGNSVVYSNLGLAYYNSGDIEGALINFKKALALTNDADTKTNLEQFINQLEKEKR